MSKVLYSNGNVHGHINPTLPLVSELVRRGEEVHYFTTGEFRQKVEAAGARFRDYGPRLYRFLQSFRPAGNHPFYTLMVYILKLDEATVSIVLEQTAGEQFDYVIHDAMLGGGSVIARRLGLPAVCTCTSFAMASPPLPPRMLTRGFHPQLDCVLAGMERIADEWGLGALSIMDLLFKKEPLNIVFTSRLLQPDADQYDDSFKFIGPSIAPRDETVDFPLDGPGKCVYISMGTINNDCSGFYRTCMEAFRDADLRVILSVGDKVDIASLGPSPGSFIIRNYVPQIEVLKHADACICHGGLNSVSEALYHGVPVILIPQANDQPMVTKRIVETGAGIGLKMEEITPKVLRKAVDRILTEDSYRIACEGVRQSFAEAGGYRAGAEYILIAERTMHPVEYVKKSLKGDTI